MDFCQQNMKFATDMKKRLFIIAMCTALGMQAQQYGLVRYPFQPGTFFFGEGEGWGSLRHRHGMA